jgi:CRP-like cAMP-binding protein
MKKESHGARPDNAARALQARDRERNVLRKVALVQHFPLFDHVTSADCREIVSLAHECEFSRRQAIFLRGDPVRNAILLTSGSAKITQLGQNGAEVIVRIVKPGDVVGMTTFCEQCNHRSTAQTVSDSTAFVWESSVFEALIFRFPALLRNIIRMVAQRLEELEERFRGVSTENAAQRLGHELVRLFNQVGRRANGTIEINLSRGELAQLSGTTLFTVNRLLSEWNERGMVRARRETVSVQDLEAFRKLAESEERISRGTRSIARSYPRISD